jgi:uncharacterized protein YjiS (DUF1127 family)
MTRFTNKEKVIVGYAKSQAEIADNAGVNSVGGALKNLMILLGRTFRRGAIASQLRRLDDRMLADIGLQRWQIASVASQAVTGVNMSVGEAFGALLTALSGSYSAWRNRRAAYRELMSLDDRMLQDIGMSRGDIPAVVASIGQAVSNQDMVTFGSLRLWNRSRHVVKELNALDNRQLDDLGFVRGDIEIVAEAMALRSLSAANRNGPMPQAA